MFLKKVISISAVFVLLFTLVANTVYGISRHVSRQDYRSELLKCIDTYNEGISKECGPSCYNLSREECDKYEECIDKHESKFNECKHKMLNMINRRNAEISLAIL